jgi:hypothetical protein
MCDNVCAIAADGLLQMVGSVLGIAAGTALAAYGETNNNVVGVIIMFASEAFESIRLVMTQLLLTGLKMGPFEGVMWLVRDCSTRSPYTTATSTSCVLTAPCLHFVLASILS